MIINALILEHLERIITGSREDNWATKQLAKKLPKIIKAFENAS